ncbi:MAG: phytoene desaturase [Candidatus Omnitrophica bacterium]|jgi:phytoene desaturase|nr:phytoene desaturase [Candidatus Omnitrophota bacterium]
MREKIVIVGAGVGGLAVTARLAHKGYDVEVFEKLSECGGRAHIIEDKGFKFDTGPSFVMMPDFFKEVFSYCREDIADYLALRTLDIHYKIFYPDGDTFTVYSDDKKTKEELERIEPKAAVAYNKLIKETEDIYKSVEPLLYKCFTPPDLLNPRYWGLISKLKIGKSYWQLIKKYFRTEKLRYAFTFESMFIGVSPFQSPAFYSVITYTDQVHKISHSMGGMYKIPQAIELMAKKFGAKFNYNSEINSIEKEGSNFLLHNSNKIIKADKVIVNADYTYAKKRILHQKVPDYDYSCSVYLIYWGIKRKAQGLAHHNLFFANDLKKNLENIFTNGVVSDDFSFYVHVPTVTDSSLAPIDKDILYVLVPVPNLKGSNYDFRIYEDVIRKKVLNKINAICGFDIEKNIEVEHKFYPSDFKRYYNIEYGATFGLAHTFWQSAFFRPANYSKTSKDLYFVGASTQPGGGLPPVLASSRIVADLITKNFLV